ncbi:hypothetical protein RN629_14430 [Sphingomonadaceae bacterium jetA1]|jgi:hypothetical protein|uniref:hypothetical protein n=1 Tax=Facivitalis istanbulensis TaxID=3075838 RepID=UPI00348520D4
MRAVMPFLACLMLVLTGWASMAHAAEMSGGRIAGVEVILHAPGDGDEVPGDGDNALPHHHNSCHAHDLGAPVTRYVVDAHAPESRTRHPGEPSLLTGVKDSVLPRPPRA